MRKLLLASMAGFALISGAHADPAAPYMGLGMHTCAEFTKGRQESDGKMMELAYFDWAQGFLSAINLAKHMDGQGQKNLNGMTFADQRSLLRAYCLDKPQKHYADAMNLLYSLLPDLPKDEQDQRE